MNPTLILSPLAVALADAMAHHTHFPSALLVEDAICCRICGVVWPTAETWAADDGVCPGYVQPCGQAPEAANG